MPNEQTKYWRVRMRYGAYEELTSGALGRGEVGVWYGAWTAQDWASAVASGSAEHALGYLNKLPNQQRLGWLVTTSMFHTMRRFEGISPSDWVVLFAGDELHLVRLARELKSVADHPLNREGELFHYRVITDHKRFALSDLPDVYRLIAPAGRGNVNEFNESYRALVGLLAQSSDEQEVGRRIKQLCLAEWLDLLGPSGWESLCEGYLILTEGYVPTGLRIGRTLRTFDIIGRNRDGVRVFASCKKNKDPVHMDENFLTAISKVTGGVRVYYFAYGGCVDEREGVRIVSRDEIDAWSRTDKKGAWYLDVFRS